MEIKKYSIFEMMSSRQRTLVIFQFSQSVMNFQTEGVSLKAALAGKKIVLVMDDVWSDIVWNSVLKIPSTNAAAQAS